MFSYYGSKSKIVDYYPPPKHKRIVEPFAGSAKYSLKYFDNDVTIIERNKQIYDIWCYLQNASEKDINSLPRLVKGDDIRSLNLSDIEKDFLGMMFGNAGAVSPCYTVSSFGDYRLRGDSLGIVAKNVFKIKHWNIIHGSCFDFPNVEATWFIDPPYQFGGHKYKFGNKLLNYSELAEWCKSRLGQVIVCENTKADWLPFKYLTSRSDNLSNAHKNRTVEAIWSNHKTNYDNVQVSLFEGQ
jgi:site-specific DNA-adenine methylase